MSYKLSKIYKLNSKEILLNITIDCNEYNFYINEKNLRYLNKTLKNKSISEAIKYWKKHEEYNIKKNKKKEINTSSLNSILNNYDIEYHFIGQYLINLTYKNNNYIIDLINDSIESCDFLDSYENKNYNKYKIDDSIKDTYSVISETDTEIEESVDVIKKIEKINNINIKNSLPNDFIKLLDLTMNNSDILKPVLNLINSKTDNLIGNFIKSSGININLDTPIDSTEIIKEISGYLKIIEDLNNNDISIINENESTKFNFVISEIWNQIKKIIYCLNKLSENDDYDTMLQKYQDRLGSIGFSDVFSYDNILLKNIIDELINNIISSLLISYRSLMESKYLEVNILLQNYKNNTSNKILDDKIDHIITNNFLLFERYFKNFFKEEDLRNIFSEFNKIIHFSNILNSLNSEAKGYIILKLSSKELKDIKQQDNYLNNLEDNIKGLLQNTDDCKNNIKLKIICNSDDVIKSSFDKYKCLINILLPTFEIFENNTKTRYQQNMLITKKKNLSELLIQFHEEIKFKLNIINKVIKSN
tara:strand:- start:271 stop:1866 length:1596 start_codon:yes stop_codon:yes gene_type:complete